MEIIVQKFGGSSVENKSMRQQVINHIINAKKQDKIPVVVVSAMGRQNEPYSTDKLIELIKGENENVSKRELDQIMSCGEVISSAVLAAGLQKSGYKAVSLTGYQAGIKTDGNYGEALIKDIDSDSIKKYLKENEVVVIAGFQGVSPEGEVNTLGRGGSDTTAAALGVHLDAEMVEVYTDVDGLMTADPKLVPKAKPIDKITFYEIFQMAKNGAKIVHPAAIEFAMKYEMPIVIKNTSSKESGTRVVSSMERINENSEDKVTGIIHTPGLVKVKVALDESNSQNDKVKLFEIISETAVQLEMFNIFEYEIIFALKEKYLQELLSELQSRGLGKINHRKGLAKITLLHAGLEEAASLSAKVLKILNEEKITVFQTSDSDISISVLTSEEVLNKAVNILHEKFL
ncbi:aspartate kinase [Natranaerofaba carboxydovora]|uniref:aspartate kinase n=1 Tax=Natranaerofaba carboxydovora TaxID=2742683 RepID=UPI001F137042|nr:aspartate kinase [Natranaerofaba carboxydovora]UMZ73425.1 Aspartokinase [Natranaerofaba carboxydovora]